MSLFYKHSRLQMAPMTNAERKRKFRQNLSKEKCEQLKKQDCMRKQHKRATTVLTPDKIEDQRMKASERQWNCRENALLRKPMALKLPFKTKQTKGKAVKKVKQALPQTPGKRMELIKEIIHSLSPKSKEAVVGENDKFATNQAYQLKQFNLVKSFTKMMQIPE